MPKKAKKTTRKEPESKESAECGCAPAEKTAACCTMEHIVTIDDRGQIVLPKELRKKMNLKSGDKFAAVSAEKGGKVCCIALVKMEEFGGMVKVVMRPMMKDIFEE